MEIHLYALCWDDADMLPFFFRHYDPIISKYFIFDDCSTDDSPTILQSHPKVELIPFLRSDPDSFTLSELSLTDECWKRSRGQADWVLVIDIDEHLYHPDLPALLRRYRDDGITIVPALGYQMISERFPFSDALLCEICTQGAPWDLYSKLAFFDPASIAETNYGLGRHGANPTGRVIAPACDELLLLHYKFLGFERTHARHGRQRSGLGSKDIDNDWAYQYRWSEEEFRHAWNGFAEKLVDVRTEAAATGYPQPRWWDPMRTSATGPQLQADISPRSEESVGEIEALEAVMMATVRERDGARAALAESDRSRGLLQEMLAERDGALAEMSRRAQELRAALEGVQAELSKRGEALQDAQAALSNQRAVTDVMQAEKAELRAALAVYQDIATVALAALQTELPTASARGPGDLRLLGHKERLKARNMPFLTPKRARSSVISLADRARDAGQWELAAAYYQNALRRKPNNPPIWVQYGHVLKESGHLAEAERAYRLGVAYDQSITDSHLQLGHALKLQGKKEEALAAYMRAFALNPSLEGARFELAQLGWKEAHFSELQGILSRDVPSRPSPKSVNSASGTDSFARYLRISEQLPGWIRGEEAAALALASLSLSGQPIIVQIGTFFGSAAVLLAGARQLQGSGKVHCIDPFDCSGDDFSVPHYRRLLTEAGGGSLRAHFERNIRSAGLEDWVEVHQGRADEVAHGWTASIDMLALGGDQSRAGARAAYESWSPFLKPGGIIAIHNSSPREYDPTHDGNRRIVLEEIVPPIYTDVRLVVHTTFARRSSDYGATDATNWPRHRQYARMVPRLVRSPASDRRRRRADNR